MAERTVDVLEMLARKMVEPPAEALLCGPWPCPWKTVAVSKRLGSVREANFMTAVEGLFSTGA